MLSRIQNLPLANLLSAAILWALPTAAAQNLVLDQPPTHTHSLLASGGAQSVADNFAVTQSGGIDIGRIRWYGTWLPTGANPGDEFDIYFHISVNGPPMQEPGSVVAQYLGITPTITATGNMMPTPSGMFPEYQLDFVFPTPAHVPSGLIWVALHTAPPGALDVFVWGMADQDATGGAACVARSPTTPGIVWYSCQPLSATDMAVTLWDFVPGVSFCDPSDPNSTGLPTSLEASLSGGPGTGVHLYSGQGPPGQFGYMLVGTNPADPGTAIGQGHLCLSTQPGEIIGRYNVVGGLLNSVGQFDANGDLRNLVGTGSSMGGLGFDIPTDLPSPLTTIVSGDTFHFQVWHRENGGSSNFSNGVSVTFP